ncbi:unnamed protein product, partial [Rotaria sp. Silwood1]
MRVLSPLRVSGETQQEIKNVALSDSSNSIPETP